METIIPDESGLEEPNPADENVRLCPCGKALTDAWHLCARTFRTPADRKPQPGRHTPQVPSPSSTAVETERGLCKSLTSEHLQF